MKNKFKYKFYEITWVDIIGDAGWHSDKQMKALEPAIINQRAYLYSKNRINTKIFSSYSFDDDGSITFGNVDVIPTNCIKEMVEIYFK